MVIKTEEKVIHRDHFIPGWNAAALGWNVAAAQKNAAAVYDKKQGEYFIQLKPLTGFMR